MSDDAKRELVDDGLFTVRQAADFLRVGRTKIYGLINSGDLPRCKIGKCVRVPRAAVVQLAERSLTLN